MKQIILELIILGAVITSGADVIFSMAQAQANTTAVIQSMDVSK